MFFKKLEKAVKEVGDELEKGLKDIDKGSTSKSSTTKESITKPGKKAIADEIDSLPVKCTIKVHSKRYNRLSMQTRVEVSSKKEYEAKKQSIMNEFRQKYGSYKTSSGKAINVWTDKAFAELTKTLIFEDENVIAALKKHGKW